MKQKATTSSNLDAVLREAAPEEVDRLRAAWQQTDGLYSTETPNPEAADQVWQALEAHIHDAPPQAGRQDRNPAPRQTRRSRSWAWMGIAASLLVGAVAVALWMQPVVKHAQPGERLTVNLPDGSRAELNSGAVLRYARRFGSTRLVHLEGEAFFDVAKAERPFVVETFNAQVTVLGTRFNVRAWSQSMDPNTTVTLEEGRIALAPADNLARTIQLEPGQTLRITQQTQTLDPLAPPDQEIVAQATAWRMGDLVFKDEWLGVILEDIERRFAIDVAVQSPSVRQKRLNLALRNPASAEAVIRDVCVALGLNYREIAGGYELYVASQSSD